MTIVSEHGGNYIVNASNVFKHNETIYILHQFYDTIDRRNNRQVGLTTFRHCFQLFHEEFFLIQLTNIFFFSLLQCQWALGNVSMEPLWSNYLFGAMY